MVCYMDFLVCESTPTCFWDGLEVCFEACTIPLSAEGKCDQHHIPRGCQLHDRRRAWDRQPTPPEMGTLIKDMYFREIIVVYFPLTSKGRSITVQKYNIRTMQIISQRFHKNVLTWQWSCSVKEAGSRKLRACGKCSFLAWRHAGWGWLVELHGLMAREAAIGSRASWD